MRIEFNHVIISDSIVITVDIIKTENNTTSKVADNINSVLKQKSLSDLNTAKILGEMIGNFGELHNDYLLKQLNGLG
jgi:uncharacterized protein YfeS